MSEMAWSVALALSSVIMGVASLWALFRPMATGIARNVADDVRRDLKKNDFHEVGVRIDQLDTTVNARIDQLDTRVNDRISQLDTTVNARMDRLETRLGQRIDQLDARLTGAISEVRTDLGRMHETQGQILEAIRAISPVGGNQG